MPATQRLSTWTLALALLAEPGLAQEGGRPDPVSEASAFQGWSDDELEAGYRGAQGEQAPTL
jgi:hypothetical protein